MGSTSRKCNGVWRPGITAFPLFLFPPTKIRKFGIKRCARAPSISCPSPSARNRCSGRYVLRSSSHAGHISTAARSGTPVTPANEPGLTLPPRHRSASLGIESVGTTAGDGGIALFHPKRARAALVSSRELSYARFQYTIR